MARFWKKTTVEAMKYTGPDSLPAILTFLGDDFDGLSFTDDRRAILYIRTLEGRMGCQVGHWVIRSLSGEHYSCSPQAFAATYEPVDEREEAPCGSSR